MERNGMARYFFDLDDGKNCYVDDIGTDIADPARISDEAIGFLASVFKDAAHDDSDRVFIANVRDEAGRIAFTTTLTLQSEWQDADYRNGATAIRQPVVLVVEDEFLTRMLALEMISDAGYAVVEAENAEQAITLLQAMPEIQIVFTDIKMPGSMDGLKLARYVKQYWPPIKIIATSGRLAVREGDLPDGGVFLPKPYTSERIATTLREFTRVN
jgi:CheY-like chemotaxis protein